MMEDIFNKTTLISHLMDLKKNGGTDFSPISQPALDLFWHKLVRHLKESFESQDWPLEKFVSLALGFYAIENLTTPKYLSKSDPHYINQFDEWDLYSVSNEEQVPLLKVNKKSLIIIGDHPNREKYILDDSLKRWGDPFEKLFINLSLSEQKLLAKKPSKICRGIKNKEEINKLIEKATSNTGLIQQIDYRRTLTILDVNKIVSLIHHYYPKLILRITSEHQYETNKNPILSQTSPLMWIELIEKINPCLQEDLRENLSTGRPLVTAHFATLIRCMNYNLKIDELETHHYKNTEQFIVNHPTNIEKQPPYYTYDQLKLRWADKPENQIIIHCENRELTAYLPVNESFIVTYRKIKNYYSDINLNLSNPDYPKRYVGLEKLKADGCPYGFDLKTLFEKGYLPVQNAYYLSPEFEQTDIETKFYIERKLKPHNKEGRSFNIKKTIELSDLIFLQDEILSLEAHEDNSDQDLTRAAIKKTYAKIKWTKRFELENSNGLIDARITSSGAKKHIYSQKKLHRWLIKEGIYKKHELDRLTGLLKPLSGIESAAYALNE